ncbi:MAG: hypothetical protein VX519_08145 [Myxococcota bacterium]|nr:hypothetical protein [Myxococcota bacterium]
MLLTALLFGFSAQAEGLNVGVGLGTNYNDPFVSQVFARWDVGYQFGILGVEGSVMYSQERVENQDWTALTTQLVDYNNISPDISRAGLGADIQAVLMTPPSTAGAANVSAGVAFGLGMVHTVDDLEALGDESARAQATEIQNHPAMVTSLISQATWSGVGLQLRVDSVAYTEIIQTDTEEKKRMNVLSLGWLFDF